MRLDLERRGYVFDTSTRAMGMASTTLGCRRRDRARAARAWPEHLHLSTAAGDSLNGAPRCVPPRWPRAWTVERRSRWRFDYDGDCGIYNVGTLEPYRRRGLARRHGAELRDAAARGCTRRASRRPPIAEGVYSVVASAITGGYLAFVPRA